MTVIWFKYIHGVDPRKKIPPVPHFKTFINPSPFTEHESYVHLSFKVRNNGLTFQRTNSKPDYPTAGKKVQTGGLGLKNIQRRLALLYPDRHSLTVKESEKNYNVILHLTL